MNRTSKNISLTAIFAALYAVGVVFLAPLSFSIYQVRLADALLPLSMIFGLPSIFGFSIGAIISNFFGGLGIIDVIGGCFANFIACSFAYYIAKKKGTLYRFIGVLGEIFIISIIVGGYLSLILFESIEISIFGIFVGSIIAILLVGFPIEEALRKSSIFKQIKEN